MPATRGISGLASEGRGYVLDVIVQPNDTIYITQAETIVGNDGV
jgi:hypothetical protein